MTTPIFGSKKRRDLFNDVVEEGTMEPEECTHSETFQQDNGTYVCMQCGLEIEFLDFDKEWVSYGESNDMVRCHRSKENSKGSLDTLFSSSDKLSAFPEAYKKQCENKYVTVVNGDTVRGGQRKAIAAACMLHVCRDNGDIRTTDEMRSLFGLRKSQMSDGMTRYLEKFREDRLKHIKPCDLIFRTAKKVDVRLLSHCPAMVRLAKKLEGRSILLIRSTPQLVASTIVYLYICSHPNLKKELSVSKSSFIAKVGPSDMTFTRLVKDATRIVDDLLDE